MRLEEKNGEFLRSKVGLTWELETSRSLNFYDGIIFTHDVSDQQAVNINHFPLWMFGVMTDQKLRKLFTFIHQSGKSIKSTRAASLHC